MNKLMISFVAVLSLTTLGCKKKGGDALAKMEGFQKAMCECKDKGCADKVNADMATWGTEMAKSAGKDEKPDPELAKKSGDIMTKYTECMTKLMMAGAAGAIGAKPAEEKPADPAPATPPVAAGKCPDGHTNIVESNVCVKLPAMLKEDGSKKGKIVGNNKASEYSWAGGDKGSDWSIYVNVSDMSEYWQDSVDDVKKPTYQGKALEDGKIGDTGFWGVGEDGPPAAGFAQRRYIKSVNKNDKKKLTCKVTRANGTAAPTEEEVFAACKTIEFAK
jgi:hypothetical protein